MFDWLLNPSLVGDIEQLDHKGKKLVEKVQEFLNMEARESSIASKRLQ